MNTYHSQPELEDGSDDQGTAKTQDQTPDPGATPELSEVAAVQAGEFGRLRGLLANLATGRVAKPPIVDKADRLAHHPSLPPYGQRTQPISMIVVHHTDTPKTITVEKIAEYHVFGERKNAQGKILKAQWPGIGYHFLVGPDGVITQGQRESARSYHVGGDPNDYSVAISLIGRFMRKNYDGTERAPEDQAPTPEQLKSAAHLGAWLMQEYNIPLEQVKGHRDVWPNSTVCPGEHWTAGLNWHSQLVEKIRAVQASTGGQPAHPIPLYLLFWDHGNAWAEGDWRSAQGYIARFRPTAGYSVADAMLAQRVVIVGGPLGVSAQDEARLKAAAVEVHRLSGKDEADTKRMLDELARAGTPWPGAPAPQDSVGLAGESGLDEVIFPDEWTMPDDWRLPEAALYEDHPPSLAPAYPADLSTLLEVAGETPAPPTVQPPLAVTTDDRTTLLNRVRAVQAAMQAGIAHADQFASDLVQVRKRLAQDDQVASAAPSPQDIQALLIRLAALETALAALPPGSRTDLDRLRSEMRSLRKQLGALTAPAEGLADLRAEVTGAQRRLAALNAQAPEVNRNRQAARQVLEQANTLQRDLQAGARGSVVPASVQAGLAANTPVVQNATAAVNGIVAGPVTSRPLGDIRQIVVHHTGRGPDASPEDLVRHAASKGRTGIPYHYLVGGDGQVHQLAGVDVVVNQSRVRAVDAGAVGIAIGGKFDLAVPNELQMAAAARLVAQLLSTFGLAVTQIWGRSELEAGTTSPGMQWTQGVRWGDDLKARSAALLAAIS